MSEVIYKSEILTRAQAEAVSQQLERLVASRHFNHSRRYPALLRFVVDAALRNETNLLRERVIGHLVFARAPEYDTNADPVVRITAAEVRKKIAQYYHENEHAQELRIELKSGSYVPDFIFPQSAEIAAIAEPPDPPASGHEQEEQYASPDGALLLDSSIAPTQRSGSLLWAGMLVVVLVLLGGVTLWQRHSATTDPLLDALWSPVFESGHRLLICIGEPGAPDAQATSQNAQQNQTDTTSLFEFFNKKDFVPFSDVEAFSQFSSFLSVRGHDIRLKSSPSTSYSQLREGPVLLIGAFDNQWTLNRTASLRFHFAGPGGTDHKTYWIEDAKHPDSRAWKLNFQDPRSKIIEDFAIISRFTDEGTGEMVLVAAGLGGSGTKAAGEFLTNERDLEGLAASAPAGWERKNFEAVLKSQVVDGMQGRPRVVAANFW